jgi:hypothetical protein
MGKEEEVRFDFSCKSMKLSKIIRSMITMNDCCTVEVINFPIEGDEIDETEFPVIKASFTFASNNCNEDVGWFGDSLTCSIFR